jgi:uncharacterized protein YjbJ (UPF0337 family)
MNDDRVKGTIDEVVGSTKRKVGQWTGNTPLQVRGIAQQVKGKLETALGKTKDAIHEAGLRSGTQDGTRASQAPPAASDRCDAEPK